jgi:hypothetical protein
MRQLLPAPRLRVKTSALRRLVRTSYIKEDVDTPAIDHETWPCSGPLADQLSLCRTGMRALLEMIGIRRIRREERYPDRSERELTRYV